MGQYQFSKLKEIIDNYSKTDEFSLWKMDVSLDNSQLENIYASLWEIKNGYKKRIFRRDIANSLELMRFLKSTSVLDNYDITGMILAQDVFNQMQKILDSKVEKRIYKKALDKKVKVVRLPKRYASLDSPLNIKSSDDIDGTIQDQHRKILDESLWMKKNVSTLSSLLVSRVNIPVYSSPSQTTSTVSRSSYSKSLSEVQRTTFSTHFTSDASLFEIAYRSGVRDFLDERYSMKMIPNVEYLNGSVLFNLESNKFKLNELVLVDIKSLNLLSRDIKSVSWGAGANIRSTNEYDFRCDNCYESNIYAAIGLNATNVFKEGVFYSLLYGSLKYKAHNKVFYPSLRLGFRHPLYLDLRFQ